MRIVLRSGRDSVSISEAVQTLRAEKTAREAEAMRKILMKEIEAVLDDSPTPLHYNEIAKRVIWRGAWQTRGRTPGGIVRARIGDRIRGFGATSKFVRFARGIYGLRSRTYDRGAPEPLGHLEGVEAFIAEAQARGWASRPRAQVSAWFGRSSWCMTVRGGMRIAIRSMCSRGALCMFRTSDDTILLCRADALEMEV